MAEGEGEGASKCPRWYATLEDVCKYKVPGVPPSRPPWLSQCSPPVNWGPVSKEEALDVRSRWPALSVLLTPSVQPNHIQAIQDLIPDEVWPRADDTANSLRQRLSNCTFLDDILFPRNGSSATMVHLNATTYSQPRRVTWSVVTQDSVSSSTQETVDAVSLFTYTQYRRRPDNFMCRPMPLSLFHLMVALWKSAWSHLGYVSRMCPPTACQLMMYYGLFSSYVGRHRDNFSCSDLLDEWRGNGSAIGKAYGHCANGKSQEDNSQVVGSDVLVWTEGTCPMVLSLSFPILEVCGSLSLHAVICVCLQAELYLTLCCKSLQGDVMHRKKYKVHPRFQVSLGPGTLFVFSCQDDVHFCHEAEFCVEHKNPSDHRFAFVFRWLCRVDVFKQSTRGLVLTPNLEASQAARKKQRVQTLSKRRASAI